MLASMPGQVALTIAVDIQPPDAAATTNRILPDASVHCAPFPADVAWKPDVDG
jgi:hypothetical protein